MLYSCTYSSLNQLNGGCTLNLFLYFLRELRDWKITNFCRTLGIHQNKNIVMLLFGTHLHFIYNGSWNAAKQYGIKFEVFFRMTWRTLWESLGNLMKHIGNSKREIPEAIPKFNSIVIDVNLGPCWVRETKTTPMNQQEPRTGQH
jgi:hypothetical protein